MTEPVDIDPADIAEATRMLVDAGWDDRAESTARDILRRGYTLDHLWELVATYLANQHRFRSPGAIWDRCERGSWAVGGIRKLAHTEAAEVWATRAATLANAAKEQADRDRRRHQRDERNRRERLAWSIVTGYRKSGDPDADEKAITSQLATHGLTWDDANPSNCYRV